MTPFHRSTVPPFHRSTAIADPMPPHDLQQTRMIREAEVLRSLRDPPLVPLQRRDDDLPLRLGLALEERSRFVRAWLHRRAFDDLSRDVVDPDRRAVGGDYHSFDDIPQLAHIVAFPVVRAKQLERLWAERLGRQTKTLARGSENLRGKLRKIGESIAQRRDVQHVHREAEQQILTKASGLHV